MNFIDQILFFFGAIGVFNSILAAIYFTVVKKNKSISDLFFGFFLFFLSERALKSIIYFFSDAQPNMYSSFGPISFIFIGPFLLLYVLSILRPQSQLVKYWKHCMLLWILVALTIHFIFPFRADPIFWKRYILLAINLQWLIHLALAAVHLFPTKGLFQIKAISSSERTWLTFLVAGVFLIWLLFFFIDFNYFILGSIVFSLLFYSFFLFFIFRKSERQQVFGLRNRYSNKPIENSTAQDLINRLRSLMDVEKPYKNPNLKSADLAQTLDISTHQLSQLINEKLNKNFTTFINEYRIEEAKRIIRSDSNYSLDAIGNEAGFNSKSTFYSAFKKQVGLTPAKFKSQF